MTDLPPGAFSRRDFLQTTAAGLAVAGLPLSLKAGTAPDSGAAMSDPFQRFGIDEVLVRRAMGEALGRGGDYCDLYFQHTVSTSIRLLDHAVNQARTGVDLGVGIRVLKGDQVGYSFTEDLSPEAILKAARTAAAIASGPGGKVPGGFKMLEHPDHHRIALPWEEVRADRKVPLLQRVDEAITKGDPRIIKSTVMYNDEYSHVLIVTSEGRLATDYRPLCTVGAMAIGQKDQRREDAYWAWSARQDLDFFTPERLDRIAKEVLDRVARGFEAVKPEGGDLEVVLAPGASGILLHEAIGHGLEADFNRKGTSIFADKIGKPIAQKFVTIVDDATMSHNRGALNIDDEANPTANTVLVENGVLRTYMHDRISAAHYKVAPTGNGRRQNFRFAPIPRMRNTYMLPGPHSREEIIRSVKKGIYAEDFTNGQVQIGAGDFTFYVKSGYLIEDGKLTRPIKDVNIIGNGPEVLAKVCMVGNDLGISESTWTCGKDGQGVPVAQGLPTCKVSSITVGGVKA